MAARTRIAGSEGRERAGLDLDAVVDFYDQKREGRPWIEGPVREYLRACPEPGAKELLARIRNER